jgi:glycosyltransferase involved in cell wall biosynthesis
MITVTILTKNCQETLAKTLDSLVRFSEVLILDTGSTDQTLDIARAYPNVIIKNSPFLGFGPTHNLASSLASHDWILSIDSDEVLSPELTHEILSLSLDSACAYSVLRHNFLNGKRMKWCGGWHPDWVTRLYNRKTTCFSDAQVHEKVITAPCSVTPLRAPLLHTPYRSMDDFLSKMQHYSTLFAEQHAGKKKSSVTKALLHSWSAFFKSYILKRGFLGGKEGFIISMYNAHTAFYKYVKLSQKSN